MAYAVYLCARSEVLTAMVLKSQSCGVLKQCPWASSFWCFECSKCLHLQDQDENEGAIVLGNIRHYSPRPWCNIPEELNCYFCY
jgi:hypothetical protein